MPRRIRPEDLRRARTFMRYPIDADGLADLEPEPAETERERYDRERFAAKWADEPTEPLDD